MSVNVAGRHVVDLGARSGVLDAMDRLRGAPGADDLVLSVAAGAPMLRSAVFLEVLRRAAGSRRIALVTADTRARSLAASVHVPAFASVAALERHELDSTEPLGKARRAAIVAAEPRAPSRARPLAVFGALFAAALVLFAVVAPTATVVVAPVSGPLGPIEYDLRAGPNSPAQADINALTLQTEVTAKFTGTATGTRTDDIKAKGTEHFTSQTTNDVRIPKGTVVQTTDGIKFVTTEDKVLPHSQIQVFPPSVSFGTVDIAIEAVDPGTKGNVAAHRITVAPSAAGQYSVTNNDPTTGGDTKKYAVVQLADYDLAASRADAELKAKADAQVETWKKQAQSDHRTVYGVLVKRSSLTAAADIVGKNDLPTDAPTFELTAVGTAVAYSIPESEPNATATAKLAQEADPGYKLLANTAVVELVGTPTVADDGVHWRVRVKAAQYRAPDEGAIRAALAGRGFDEVNTVVADRGLRLVRVSTWPGQWPRMPFLDARIRIQTEGSASSASP
ncbi:MAG TPA: baseplate J/gp47 family protein [Candidatus Limnocylindria bacterium]